MASWVADFPRCAKDRLSTLKMIKYFLSHRHHWWSNFLRSDSPSQGKDNSITWPPRWGGSWSCPQRLPQTTYHLSTQPSRNTNPSPIQDMASHASAPQAINGTDQAFWSHFQRIYLDSHLLLKKLTSLSLPSPTEQDLASIQEIPGRFVTAVAAVHSIIPIFSSALAARLQSLEQLLPRYLAPLSTSAIDTASVPDAQLPPTNDELVRLLTSVVVQLPARDDKEAWTAVFTDVETLCGWHRHRELECELRNLREQANRKNAPPVAASLHLSELVRELASLPETVSLSCSPGLRKRLMDYEKSEEVWEKADEERRRAADQETGQRDAMVSNVFTWFHRPPSSLRVSRHAWLGVRSSEVMAQVSKPSIIIFASKDWLTCSIWSKS